MTDEKELVEKVKAICTERRCEWKGVSSDILTAPNPFETNEIITGCPKCKGINTVVQVCDQSKCWEIATCGTPIDSGYRQTCYSHRPVVRRIK